MSQLNASNAKEFHQTSRVTSPREYRSDEPEEKNVERTSDQAVYLIVLKHVVVAEDLAQIVSDFDPAAEVLQARDTATAVQAVRDIDALRVAFLIDDRHVDGWADLVSDIFDRGGRVVLIPRSEGPRTAPFDDCLILDRPFTTEMVQATLAAALRLPYA